MNAAVRDWLFEGGPRPAEADALLAADPELAAMVADLEAIDDAVADLPVLVAPPALAARTLSAALSVAQDPPEVANNAVWSRRRWVLIPGGLLSMAAAAMLALGMMAPAPDYGAVGDPADFVPRGGPSVGHVGLRIAVQRDGKVTRLSEAPKPGDNLLFRYEVDRPGSLRLLQFAGGRVAEIGRTEASPGSADFPSEGGPSEGGLLAWQVDPGDPPAVFALVTCAIDPTSVSPSNPTDPRAVCAALRDAGCSCDAVAVQGSP